MTAVTSNDVWAVGFDRGQISSATETAGRTLIEHWDGLKWRMVNSPSPESANGNALWAVTAIRATDVWAVGSVDGVLDTLTSTTPLVAHWDGSAWTQVIAPGSGQLLGLAAEPAGAGLSATGATIKPASPTDYLGTLAQHLCPT